MARQRTIALVGEPSCPVCDDTHVMACEIPQPPGDWPWPRFVGCPFCTYPYLGIQTFHRRAS